MIAFSGFIDRRSLLVSSSPCLLFLSSFSLLLDHPGKSGWEARKKKREREREREKERKKEREKAGFYSY